MCGFQTAGLPISVATDQIALRFTLCSMETLLNRYEKITYERLTPVCDRNGAYVFAKVRLKDVLPIDGSGVGHDDYRFSLQSHFDFVVTDRTTKPLFAVEYDGAMHSRSIQIVRDSRKNRLCEKFGLSLLRINSRYLDQRFRDLDLLTYFVEVWFLSEAFYEAQREGAVPYDEDFDPWLIISDPHHKGRFPYWLSSDAQLSFRRLAQSGSISEPTPSHIVGVDTEGSFRCLTWIAIAAGKYALVRTGMRAQRFPVVLSDLISQIAACELLDRVSDIIAGKVLPTPQAEMMRLIQSYQSSYRVRSMGGYAHYQQGL